MKTAFHGTSADNFKSILKMGKLTWGNGNENWNASAPAIYAWHCDGDKEEAMLGALGNSELALVKSKDFRRVVIEIEIDGLDYAEDLSCENMDGAIEIQNEIPLDRIVGVWIDDSPLDLFKVFLISDILKMVENGNQFISEFNYPEIFELPKYMRDQLVKINFDYSWRDDFQVEKVENWVDLFAA